MPKRLTILAGVDLEGRAVDAVALAAALATRADADLQLLHVAEATRKPWPHAPALSGEEIKKRERDAFRPIVEVLPAGCRPVMRAVAGHPVRALVDAARSLPADLLVLGRPHQAFTDHLIGGTVQKVIRICPIPVLIHKTSDRTVPKHVLASVDLSPTSLHALDVALSWAAAIGASIHVLYVFEPPDFAYHSMGLSMPHHVVDEIRAREYEDFDRRMAAVAWRGVPHTFEKIEGEPAPTILDAFRRAGAGLLALGTHGRTGLDRFLLGSVAEYVARRADRSVLVIPLA